MDAKILNEQYKELTIKVGDVVKVEGFLYLIMEEKGIYSARSFSGIGGSVGSHDTLEGLAKRLNDYSVTVFSQNDYEIQITKKNNLL